jgi:DNA-binding CsgD family transcriptional regulator
MNADHLEHAAATVPNGHLGALLDCLAEPVFVLDADRKILYRNSAAQRVLGAKTGVQLRAGRLVFALAKHDEKLIALLDGWKEDVSGECRGFAVARGKMTRDWLVVVRPLAAERKGRVFLVQLIARLRPREVPVFALRDLFGLSDREIDVVSALLASNSPRAVARRMTVGRETVRTHLKRIFRKCNVHSQTELLSLIHSLSVLAASAA